MSTATISTPAVATTYDALSYAKNLLLTDGWVVGNWKCATGARCAAGAVRAACGHAEYPATLQARKDRVNDPLYRDAIFALADAIDPKWRARQAADYGYDRFEDVEIGWQLDIAEDVITTYNDDRVNNRQGRNTVLGRFDRAIASTSS